MGEKIKLTNGKILEKIGSNCIEGDFVYFTYIHHYNSLSRAPRFIPSKFIRYCRENKNVIIKREDCKNNSRVSIESVLQLVN